jgi:RNA polymerase sigma-70 factor, ECF subfamily
MMKDDGDELAAELVALYREHFPGLVRHLRRKLRDGGLAEQIAQEAFTIMVRRWPDIRNHECLKGYLYKVAGYLMLRTLKERSFVFLPGELPDQEREDPSDSYNTSLAIREAIGKLPERQRDALWLYHIEDYKQNDIAEFMHIRRSTVAALIRQARKNLAGLLGWSDGEGQILWISTKRCGTSGRLPGNRSM